MPVGLGPDIVHVVPEMALSAIYRPTVSALRAAGIPKPGTAGVVLRHRRQRVPPADPGGAVGIERRSTGAAMLDDSLLSILVCPADRGPLVLVDRTTVLYNPRLRRAYRIEDGIPVLLIDEARDVDDDEHARLMARGRPADPQ